jgi:hypothetical protein
MKIGPNIYRISNAAPDNCIVEQVAYNVRHGSRYPDPGAYAQWTTLHAKVDFIRISMGRYNAKDDRSKQLPSKRLAAWLSWRIGSLFLRTRLHRYHRKVPRDTRRLMIWDIE